MHTFSDRLRREFNGGKSKGDDTPAPKPRARANAGNGRSDKPQAAQTPAAKINRAIRKSIGR